MTATPSKRGVVATASYEARRAGVQSGTPLRTAARRLPDGVFLPVDREAYEAASAEVMAVLRGTDAVVEVLGWDEAFLGVDDRRPRGVRPRPAARVLAATRLDCSVGIGRNKLQAKIATGYGKPAGVYRLTGETGSTCWASEPHRRAVGHRPATAARLAGEGVRTVRELAGGRPRPAGRGLRATIGPWLVRLGQGVDDTPRRWGRTCRGRAAAR